MPQKPKRHCLHPGCPVLTSGGYCPAHRRAKEREQEARRGTATQRGYNYRWNKYSKWFLSQPGNELCKLRLDARCSGMGECVDHIKPPTSPVDPLFWDPANHQPSCIVCNSKKGRREIKGKDWDIDL